MKKLMIIPLMWLILCSLSAQSEIYVEVQVQLARQEGAYINNSASSTLYSSFYTKVTNAVGWTTYCDGSDNSDIDISHTADWIVKDVVYKNLKTIPSGWLNKWECGKSYSCRVRYRALGATRLIFEATVFGTGFNIDVQEGVTNTDERTIFMKRTCGSGGKETCVEGL